MGANLTAGIDIGGTKILSVILKNGVETLGSNREPTGITKKNRTMDNFVASALKTMEGALYKSKLKLADLKAIGIGCAGQIELSTGDVLDSPHLPWKRIPLKRMIENGTGRPVVIINDVQSAAWGEFALGAGKNSRNMVCVFVGTGIGSGIVIDGKLYRGSAGSAGEVGHSSYRVGGIKCKCGERGCAEAYIGGELLWRRARKAILRGTKTKIADLIADLDHIPASIIHEAAKKGDPFAKRMWRDAELALGTLAHNCVNILNPDTFVLGGGVVEGLPYLRDFVKAYIDERAVPTAARAVKVVAPLLGATSGAVGAANMAFISDLK